MPIAPLRQLPLWGREESPAPFCSVRASARARRLSVRVWRDGAVEVVVPPRTAPAEVEHFIQRHRSWIERQRARCQPFADEAFPPARIVLAAMAESWECVARPGLRTLQPVASGCLLLPPGIEPARLRQQLRAWLGARAQVVLASALAAVAAEMGASYQRLQIRRQRTRWGSCSTRGTISLNCCLLFQPPQVVRYLLVHELAHLAHMNHSARFWRQVERFEPRWRELDRELLQGWRQVPRWALG